MNEILRMARQAAFNAPIVHDEALMERFARLVAAHEREACAALADEWSQGRYPEVAEQIRQRSEIV